jgi:hypothetical protein
MVIDVCIKNRVVALRKSLFEASVQKARNRPSTQLIEATSCVESSKPQLKPKSTVNFLAIKRQQRIKIVEVTKLQSVN